MPFIHMELPVCTRCYHVWLPELEEGEKSAVLDHLKFVPGKRKMPKRCASCGDPNWNRRRRYHMRAQPRKKPKSKSQQTAEARSMSGAEIFERVMKTVKPKTKPTL